MEAAVLTQPDINHDFLWMAVATGLYWASVTAVGMALI